MKENREEYQNEKEKREKRLLAYADMIQSAVQRGFFRSDTTIGGGKKETETNAKRNYRI